MWMDKRMKKMIVAKIRYIKRNVFAASAVPNDINGFVEALSKIEDNELSEIEKSWYSYKLKDEYIDYMYQSKMIKKLIYSLMSPFVYFGISCKKRHLHIEKKDAVYYCVSDNKGILPEKYKKISDIKVVPMGEGLMLDKEAREILKESFKICKGKVYFLMEEILALANYSYICNKYNPNEIITSYESFYANPVLTLYCHKKNVIHTNIMHGEKLLSPLNILGDFDNMYIWDEHYLQLFQSLKYHANQYIIENPWEKNDLPEPLCFVDYTFYMNFENEESLKHIIRIAQELKKKGKIVRIRLHPSQLQENKLKDLVPKEMFDNNTVNIMQSIANTRFAVSRYSTVLYQAYSKGKSVVIDDVSNSQEFKLLKQLDYIMMGKEHKLLSQIMKEEGILH
jgi:serine/threonine protein kinase